MQLSQVADLARSLDVSSFVARLPDPVLIGSEVFSALERGTTFDTPERGTPVAAFATGRASRERAPSGSGAVARDASGETSLDFGESPFGSAVAECTPPSGTMLHDPEVLFVAKTERNPFRQMITVGRSQNNDIVLVDRGVSKVHGYFVKTDFRWWIHDQPSTNGTFVDESRVGASGMPIADGCKVSFGPRLVFSFYTARGLHHLITGRR